jgi:hypothetical protein
MLPVLNCSLTFFIPLIDGLYFAAEISYKIEQSVHTSNGLIKFYYVSFN